MSEDPNSEPIGASRFVLLAVGFVILVLLLLPPVKQTLNRIPYLWEVLYPLTMVLSGYLALTAALAREPLLSVGKWSLLFVAAACMAGFVYGAAPIFFTLGRWGALLFIAAEVVLAVMDARRVPAKT